MMNNPTLHMNVDRTRAQQVGLTERDVAENLLISLSSSSQTTPTFWVNPATGTSYPVAVMTPQYKMNSLQELMNTQ
jgi:multidrug efflux pump subunit AcrB